MLQSPVGHCSRRDINTAQTNTARTGVHPITTPNVARCTNRKPGRIGTYQDEDGLLRPLQQLRDCPHVVVPIDMPG